ncbi:MAG: hypothetical protein KBA61_01775 [Spirochaetes bacterium]|nr:hypothetical protein [Spirochaetota bacterium]
MAEETQAPQAAPAEGATQEQKTKKINRLTSAELDKKIGELEGGNHVKSVYYKHLLQRKKELAGS